MTCKRFNLVVLGTYLSLCFCLRVVEATQCSAADVEYWEHGGGFFEFEDVAEEAGKDASKISCPDCTVEEFYPDAKPIIDQYFDDYSPPCRDCFNGLISCVRLICLNDCIGAFFTGFSAECELCAETFCRPPFTNCSGISVVTCDGCTNPADNNLTPIIIGAVAAFAGACVLFLGYKGYHAYKNAPTADEAALQQLVVMGILVEDKPNAAESNTASLDASTTVLKGQPTPFPDGGKYGEESDFRNFKSEPFPDRIESEYDPFPDEVTSMPPVERDPFPDKESTIPMSVVDGDDDEPPAGLF